MYEWLRTDNDFANSEFRSKLANDPALAALIDYLVAKGVVNEVEFGAAVNERYQALVSATENVIREDR
jgi:hypothetical protein